MKKSDYEKKYTSTKAKLLHNTELLANIKNGHLVPQSIQIAPTDKCNLNCVFCSTKNREKDELTYDDVKTVLRSFRVIGAKTVEFTGGGDPTLHKDINNMLETAFNFNYKVGFITNGVALKKNVSKELIERMTWIRISLNCLDYVGNIDLDIDTLYRPTLGFSYVWNEYSTKEMIDKLKIYKNKYKAKYVRVVPDCRNVKFIEEYREKIMPLIEESGIDGAFFQQKEYIPPERCWAGYIKPFVNADGYIYHCSANPLIDLKFNHKFRMGHINDIFDIWYDPKPFYTDNCGECFFKEHNEIIENLLLEIEHEEFI